MIKFIIFMLNLACIFVFLSVLDYWERWVIKFINFQFQILSHFWINIHPTSEFRQCRVKSSVRVSVAYRQWVSTIRRKSFLLLLLLFYDEWITSLLGDNSVDYTRVLAPRLASNTAQHSLNDVKQKKKLRWKDGLLMISFTSRNFPVSLRISSSSFSRFPSSIDVVGCDHPNSRRREWKV